MKFTVETRMLKKAGVYGGVVYGYVAENPDVTVKELCVALNMANMTVWQHLTALQEAGYLKLIRKSNREHAPIVRIEVLK